MKKKFCYYCDEKYEFGYKYKMRQNFLLNGHKSEGKATSEAKNDQEDDLVVLINVIFRPTSHQTMKIHGNIKKKVVTITSLILKWP